MGEGIAPNQAGILAQSSVIGSCARKTIPGEVNDTRPDVCSVALIMFSDISHSIKAITLRQDKITVH